ncbi:hypothetical protein HZS_1420, partial [Henneguya salminicola]
MLIHLDPSFSPHQHGDLKTLMSIIGDNSLSLMAKHPIIPSSDNLLKTLLELKSAPSSLLNPIVSSLLLNKLLEQKSLASPNFLNQMPGPIGFNPMSWPPGMNQMSGPMGLNPIPGSPGMNQMP